MESSGFLHFKDVFSRRSIELLYDYVINIDLQEETLKYIHVSYDYNSGVMKTPTKNASNSQTFFENIKEHLNGYNFNVNSNNRIVFQLYNKNQNPDISVSNQKLPDGTFLAKLYSRESMNFVKNFFAKNKQFIENLVSLNKKLYPYLSIYPVHEYTKLFINRPNCLDQEVHCDQPDEIERNTMYLIIPLNDCDEDMGTTVFYDNRQVKKYFTKGDDSWYNKGLVKNLDNDQKKIFELAEYNVPFQVGDAIIFFGDTIHRGTRNQSKKSRLFLHMAFQKN